LEFTPIAELLARPEEKHRWLVEERLLSGGVSVFAGKPKAGKSTAARSLALSVARGEPWLGMATHQGPVLYLAMEERQSEVIRHFKQMGATNEPIRCCVSPAPKDGVEQLLEWAKEEAPVLIIVDPLFRLVQIDDTNSYGLVTKALNPLIALAHDTDAHVMAVHHIGKGDRIGADGILGSTAIHGSVDTALLLTKTSDDERWLSTEQRSGPSMSKTRIDLDAETGRAVLRETRTERAQTRIAAAVVNHLKRIDGDVTQDDVFDNVEGKKANVRKALNDLVEDGTIVRTGVGKKSDPVRYRISRSQVPVYRDADSGTGKAPDPKPAPGELMPVDPAEHLHWLKDIDPNVRDYVAAIALRADAERALPEEEDYDDPFAP
jgi:RecA-family ATPase